jgi:hypothetical protein
MQAFADALTNDVVRDAERRIRFANLRKLAVALGNGADGVAALAREAGTLAGDVKSDWAHVDAQIGLAGDRALETLRTATSVRLRKFVSGVRQDAYERIDQGIDGKALKSFLESRFSQRRAGLEADLETEVKRTLETLQHDAADLLDRFAQRVTEFQRARAFADLTGRRRVEFAFSLASGVDTGALLAAVASVAGLLLFPPTQVALIVLSVVSLVVSVGKTVWSFFDKGFAREQQRRAVDENLRRIAKELDEQVTARQDELKQLVEKHLDQLRELIRQSVDDADRIHGALRRCGERLELLQHQMEPIAP